MMRTSEEIDYIALAKQAGFTSGEIAWHDNMFEAFAKLVAAKERADEREACAKLCDSVNNYDNPMTANDVADAIRARGTHE